jgi:hypothetical protein
MSAKNPRKKRKPQPRLPLEAALKLRSHSVSTKKGLRGYDRKQKKEQNRAVLKEDLFEEND